MNTSRKRRRPAQKGRQPADARQVAAAAVRDVLAAGRSLSDCLSPLLASLTDPGERSLAQELAFGTLRWQPRLAFWLSRLLERPLKARDSEVQAVLLVGLYQCSGTRMPAHAAVATAVDAARALSQPWAAGMANAVLRRFLRERQQLEAAAEQDAEAASAHPAWLLECLRRDWPEHWQHLVAANNSRPPMTLRVNRRRYTAAEYKDRLAREGIAAVLHAHAAEALVLDAPVSVERLPDFQSGAVSVQDAAGQLAASLLQLEPGQRVLDLCAAPGSKTCHMLEREPGLAGVTAVDLDEHRLQRLTANLGRLGLEADVRVGDGLRPETWWDGKPYQRILLDAPCSATGVIRRHPDIKLLRRAADIAALTDTQSKLLQAVWPLLDTGGMLVYATCSVLPGENQEVVREFLSRRPDAREEPLAVDWGMPRPVGRQIITGTADMDGFYYAVLRKQ
ncbi:MAG: 16S rRNA (cytosine(967)-C(5))-methyltransferase RsmB [Ectothiorhodospiraceae bacterium]|nr:16S rRNA (cytosine(967)-C(5))-methyltransferase RsmB [Ectothiorhodospiraceae bacterium]